MSDNASQGYCILFNGELRPGVSREQALEKLSRLTNLTVDELLDALFSVKPVIVNRVQTQELAETYVQAFGDAGLIVAGEAWSESHGDLINAELSFSLYAPKDPVAHQPNFVIELEESDGSQTDGSINGDSDAAFCLVFSGKLQSNQPKHQVVENICRLTDVSADRVIEEVFSIVPVVLYRHSERKLVDDYLEIFSAAGLKLTIQPSNECEEILAESSLRIRRDKPQPLPEKKVHPFSLALGLFAVLGALGWVMIYRYFDGFLISEPATSIAVELTAQPLIESNAPAVEPDARLPGKPSVTPPDPKPAANAARQAAQQPAPSPASSQDKSSRVTVKSEAQRNAEQNYYMTLLNWFAQPAHQGYDADTRALNLEGEIEIEITLARDGSVTRSEVLRSTSEKLSQVTLETAQRASPFPPVPDEIKGDIYSFKLPLKYTLDNK